MRSLVDELSQQFGKQNLKMSGHILKTVVCTADQLEDVHEAIMNAVGLTHSPAVGDQAQITTATGIVIKDIPYLTNDPERLRDELQKHLEHGGERRVQRLVCPVGRNAEEAIAMFETIEGGSFILCKLNNTSHINKPR